MNLNTLVDAKCLINTIIEQVCLQTQSQHLMHQIKKFQVSDTVEYIPLLLSEPNLFYCPQQTTPKQKGIEIDTSHHIRSHVRMLKHSVVR